MSLLKRYFFTGMCTSTVCIFMYETLRPSDFVIDSFMDVLIVLFMFAVIFSVTGILYPVFAVIHRKWEKYENVEKKAQTKKDKP